MPYSLTKAEEEVRFYKMANLKDLALKLLSKGPHKLEITPRRVRALFDGAFVFETTEPRHVWEHPYYPQFYIPFSAIKESALTKGQAVDEECSAFLATLRGKTRSTERVICFEKGPLSDLVRFDFDALGKQLSTVFALP